MNCLDVLRGGDGPFILHIKTMRYMEHVGPGEDFAAGYRSEVEVTDWKKLDPIFDYGAAFHSEVALLHAEIQKAVDFAIDSPVPTKEELLKDVI
jgi:pyruvate dehydrogenase E1 component alpha subunit